MKYIKFIVLGFTIFLFVGCDFLSCPANSNKPDSYYFNKMEPLEWSDDYIVAATNYPNQIQVWDSKTNRMIHKYSLFTDETKWEQGTERALRVYSIAVYEGVIWFIGIGMQTSLIRLDCKTGEMKYINLDITPWEVVVVPEENGGKGAIVTASYAEPRSGVSVRFLDTDGNVFKKSDISYTRINLMSSRGTYYENGEYYLTASKDDYFTKEEYEGFKLIKITGENENCISDISTEKFFDENFIKDNFGRDVQKYTCNATMLEFCTGSDSRFMELNISDDDMIDENGGKYIRFLYKVNSLENFSIEYTGIKYDEDDARTFFNVHNDDENIFVTGRSLYKTTKKDLRGLETGLYPKNGGEQIKRVPMPEGNQVYCDRREDCAYFSKDVYTQDEVTYEWDKTKKPAIYKLDYKTQTVYEYDADGNETVLDWIED